VLYSVNLVDLKSNNLFEPHLAASVGQAEIASSLSAKETILLVPRRYFLPSPVRTNLLSPSLLANLPPSG